MSEHVVEDDGTAFCEGDGGDVAADVFRHLFHVLWGDAEIKPDLD